MPNQQTNDAQTLELNIDQQSLAELARTYQETGWVQVPEILEPASADRIYQALSEQEEWNLAWNDQGKHTDLSYLGVNNWTQQQRDSLFDRIHSQAESDFQYCYAAIPIYDIYHNRLMPGHFFNDIYELTLQSAFIALARAITGNDSVSFADMQATRFSRGHFLNEHDDNVDGKNRVAAYVLNLTPTWRTDWGGALVVHPKDGLASTSVFPSYNALNVFSVPQKHSVSYVTPFAGANRYSLTGWFRY